MYAAGTIKAYAVTAKNRLATAADIPTVDEAGLPGFYISIWHALWAPKGTPDDIIARLNEAVVSALADPDRAPATCRSGPGNSVHAISSHQMRSAPCRRPKSKSGGPSSRRRTSKRSEPTAPGTQRPPEVRLMRQAPEQRMLAVLQRHHAVERQPRRAAPHHDVAVRERNRRVPVGALRAAEQEHRRQAERHRHDRRAKSRSSRSWCSDSRAPGS